MNTSSRDGTDKISTSKLFTEKYRRFTEHFTQHALVHMCEGGLFGKVGGRARRVGLTHH